MKGRKIRERVKSIGKSTFKILPNLAAASVILLNTANFNFSKIAEHFKPQPEVAYVQKVEQKIDKELEQSIIEGILNESTQNSFSWVDAEESKESFVILSTLHAEEQYTLETLTAEAVFKWKGNALKVYVYDYLPTLKDTIKTPQQLKNLFLEKIEKKEIWKGSSAFGITLSFGGLRIGIGVSHIGGDVYVWLGDPGYTLVEVNYLKDFARSIGMDPMDVGMYIRAHGGPHYLRYAIERLFNKNNDVNIREAIFYTTKDEKGATGVVIVEKKKSNGKYDYVVGTGMFNREINVPFAGFAHIKDIPKIVEFGGLQPIGYPLEKKEFPIITGAGFDAELANGEKAVVVFTMGKHHLRTEKVKRGYLIEGINEDSVEFTPYLTYYNYRR